MSTLVIVRKGSTGVIGADTMFSHGSLKVEAEFKTNSHKIYSLPGAYIGFTGWAAMQSVFESIMDRYPGNIKFQSRRHIFETSLFLHQKLKADYFLETKEKDDQPVESSQWDCVILSTGGIFAIESYRGVSEYTKFWAQGSGTDFALGAMNATYDLLEDPIMIATAGLTAATRFDKSTAAPIHCHSMGIDPSA